MWYNISGEFENLLTEPKFRQKNKTKEEKMKKKNLTLYTTRGALIAAIYVALTAIASAVGLSSGAIQFRISEALCILPIFMSEAVPGLFIGCLVSNILSGCVVWDVIFGSLATLIGAIGARLLIKLPEKFKWVCTLPTILANAIIVPFVLIYAYGVPDAYWLLMISVAVGEIVCAGIGGTGLYYLIKKRGAGLIQ